MKRGYRMDRPATVRRVQGRISPSLLLITLLGASAAVGAWSWLHRRPQPARIYSAAGFGGLVGLDKTKRPDTLLQEAADAYAAGRYIEAEQKAETLVLLAQGLPRDRQAQHGALLARRIEAYGAARRQDFALARERFEQLRQAAYESPDHGKQRVALGEVTPTLEEEGAFQKAVCTVAEGKRKAAEQQFNAFLRHYPQSILIHAVVKRVARFHAGNVPEATEALWTEAMQEQKALQVEQKREEALCGPECLSEWLKRQRKSVSVNDLAREAGSTSQGTSMADLEQTAHRHGLRVQGVALTDKGLAAQKLPLLTLVMPGHYVLVEAVQADRTTVWDPDATGIGQGARRDIPEGQWKRMWSGNALILPGSKR